MSVTAATPGGTMGRLSTTECTYIATYFPKKRVSSLKSVYFKNLISGSHRRWTLGFCMEATQSLNPVYQH